MPDLIVRKANISSLRVTDLGYGLLWLAFALGFFVVIEPAPFDIIILGLGALALAMGLRISGSLSPLIILCTIIILTGLIALTQTQHLSNSTRHILITAYLIIIAFIIAGFVYNNPERGLRAIFSGQVLAAFISALLGIIGYFNLVPGSFDLFTEYSRAKGAFKDPNVFGPFLILGCIYALYQALTLPLTKSVLWLTAIAVISLGIFLSFSRGAWGHFALSTILCLFFLLSSNRNRSLNLRIVSLSIIGAGILALIVLIMMNMPGVSEMLSHRAGLTQSYDIGGRGRFDGQSLALRWILSSPLGYGQNDFGYFWGEQPHNVYLYMFLQTGWLGGLAYLSLVIASCVGCVAIIYSTSPWRGYAVILAATFIPLALEGLLVDTDHWRHFWVLIGMIWGLIAWHRDWNVRLQRKLEPRIKPQG